MDDGVLLLNGEREDERDGLPDGRCRGGREIGGVFGELGDEGVGEDRSGNAVGGRKRQLGGNHSGIEGAVLTQYR